MQPPAPSALVYGLIEKGDVLLSINGEKLSGAKVSDVKVLLQKWKNIKLQGLQNKKKCSSSNVKCVVSSTSTSTIVVRRKITYNANNDNNADRVMSTSINGNNNETKRDGNHSIGIGIPSTIRTTLNTAQEQGSYAHSSVTDSNVTSRHPKYMKQTKLQLLQEQIHKRSDHDHNNNNNKNKNNNNNDEEAMSSISLGDEELLITAGQSQEKETSRTRNDNTSIGSYSDNKHVNSEHKIKIPAVRKTKARIKKNREEAAERKRTIIPSSSSEDGGGDDNNNGPLSPRLRKVREKSRYSDIDSVRSSDDDSSSAVMILRPTRPKRVRKRKMFRRSYKRKRRSRGLDSSSSSSSSDDDEDDSDSSSSQIVRRQMEAPLGTSRRLKSVNYDEDNIDGSSDSSSSDHLIPYNPAPIIATRRKLRQKKQGNVLTSQTETASGKSKDHQQLAAAASSNSACNVKTDQRGKQAARMDDKNQRILLVSERDTSRIPEYLFLLMSQFIPDTDNNRFTNQKSASGRSSAAMSIICRHCQHAKNPFRYTASSLRGFGSRFKTTHDHIRKCKTCSDPIKYNLKELELSQARQWIKCKPDAESKFYERVWKRLNCCEMINSEGAASDSLYSSSEAVSSSDEETVSQDDEPS